MTQINEINNTRRLRKSAAKPIALFTRVVEDFNSAANNPSSIQGVDLNSRPPDCKFNAGVQAFSATISGIRFGWARVLNAFLEYHRPIITNAFPP